MSNDTEARCQEPVSMGAWERPRACGRPVKRDGRCGIHAAARERRLATDSKRGEAKSRADDVNERLRDLGLNAYASPGTKHYAGSIRVEVDADVLLAWIEARR